MMPALPHPWTLGEPLAPLLRQWEALSRGAELGTPLHHQPAAMLTLLDRRRHIGPLLQGELPCLLCPEEQERLIAMRRSDDRERFLLAHGALRLLLGAIAGRPADQVAIQRHPGGKPHQPDGPLFSLAHSGDLVLLGLHPVLEVGVDVERPRPGLRWRAIARRVLSNAERQRLETIPAHHREQRFLEAWCGIEARLKARGCGLEGLSVLCAQPPDTRERVWTLSMPAGYAGALAVTERGPATAPENQPGSESRSDSNDAVPGINIERLSGDA